MVRFRHSNMLLTSSYKKKKKKICRPMTQCSHLPCVCFCRHRRRLWTRHCRGNRPICQGERPLADPIPVPVARIDAAAVARTVARRRYHLSHRQRDPGDNAPQNEAAVGGTARRPEVRCGPRQGQRIARRPNGRRTLSRLRLAAVRLLQFRRGMVERTDRRRLWQRVAIARLRLPSLSALNQDAERRRLGRISAAGADQVASQAAAAHRRLHAGDLHSVRLLETCRELDVAVPEEIAILGRAMTA